MKILNLEDLSKVFDFTILTTTTPKNTPYYVKEVSPPSQRPLANKFQWYEPTKPAENTHERQKYAV